MHPVLSHKHSDCKGVIELLQQCHVDHPIRKFLGYCNPLKQALDDCLQRDVCTSPLPSSLSLSLLSLGPTLFFLAVRAEEAGELQEGPDSKIELHPVITRQAMRDPSLSSFSSLRSRLAPSPSSPVRSFHSSPPTRALTPGTILVTGVFLAVVFLGLAHTPFPFLSPLHTH